MNIGVFGISDVGMRRERNEDSYLINKEIPVFAIADGMGGHVGGKFASHLAIQTIEEILSGMDNEDLTTCLKNSIKEASRRIYLEAKKDPSLKGMGTTSVVMIFRNNKVYIANVGDSRAYLVRNGKITQLTEDHSLVGEQLRAGVISEYAARGHKLKNIITRSVGFQEDVEIDIMVRILQDGDKYLLCSDGLTNMVSDDEILDVVMGNPIEEACHILVDMANARGGDDNITIILSEVAGIGDLTHTDMADDESTIGI